MVTGSAQELLLASFGRYLAAERGLAAGKLDTKLPIFLAFAAALGIAYGGWRAMGEDGTTFASIGKRLESPRRSGRPT